MPSLAELLTHAREASSRDQCAALDRDDPLGALRAQFVAPPGVIYLDGNSLGQLPVKTATRIAQVVTGEWGQGLIRSWNDAGWMDLPTQVGNQIARLVGARPGELIVCDSTSVNLFKVLRAALALWLAANPAKPQDAAAPVVVSQPGNFPTDLYIAQSAAADLGFELELCDAAQLEPRLADPNAAPVAALVLTQVDYRTGAIHDLGHLSACAHAAGAFAIWDLAHSAGAIPVDLHQADADFAVGCGYKFLNGGPGAPAFVWAHPRWVDKTRQPLAGWLGHTAPFDFAAAYSPAQGIRHYLGGTPPILSLTALECGVQTVLAAEPLGGMAALHAKAQGLTELFIRLVARHCDRHELELLSPTDPAQRGCQVSLRSPLDGYAIVQALIERGVIGDFRASDVLRFGFSPLPLRYVDVWDAVMELARVLDTGTWRDPRYAQRHAVT